jgi:predicted transposase YdaD
MGQKDIISKSIFKRILVDVATYIFKLQLESVELIETERRADLVARVVDSEGKAFILHLEIQNQNQKTMPDRMLRYLTDIRLNYPDEDVFQYLLYIGKDALTMRDNIATAQLNYRYPVIDMHDIDYHVFMAQNTPDALVMAILCDFKDSNTKAVVHEIICRLMELTQDDKKSLREYIRMLEILASNRHFDFDIQQEFEMLEIEIEKLPSFVMGEKKGEKKKALTIAKQLLAINLSIETIIQVTGLSKSDLENLKNGG